MEQDILTIRQPESDDWTLEPAVGVCGNQTLEGLIQRIENGIHSKSTKVWDYYLWSASGDHESDDGEIVYCDRWHLDHYEVCIPPQGSRYQAIVVLYYQPALIEVSKLAA